MDEIIIIAGKSHDSPLWWWTWWLVRNIGIILQCISLYSSSYFYDILDPFFTGKMNSCIDLAYSSLMTFRQICIKNFCTMFPGFDFEQWGGWPANHDCNVQVYHSKLREVYGYEGGNNDWGIK